MSAPMGRSLLINAAGAALIDHHLRARGQDIRQLPEAISAILEKHRREFDDNDQRLNLTNDIHVAARTSDFTQTGFRVGGAALHMPPLLGSLKADEDGDIVFRMREMMITPDVIYNGTSAALNSGMPSMVRFVTTRRLPETIIVAAQGRPLSDLLSHPALDGRGLRIAKIANMPEGNTFNLRGTPAMGTAITIAPAGKVVLPLD